MPFFTPNTWFSRLGTHPPCSACTRRQRTEIPFNPAAGLLLDHVMGKRPRGIQKTLRHQLSLSLSLSPLSPIFQSFFLAPRIAIQRTLTWLNISKDPTCIHIADIWRRHWSHDKIGRKERKKVSHDSWDATIRNPTSNFHIYHYTR